MANKDDGLGRKISKGKTLCLIGLGGLSGGGLLDIVWRVLDYFDKEIPPAQIFKFLDSWQGVILGIGFFITVVLIERHWQDSLTKRNKDNREIDQNKINEYETKLKEMDKKLDEAAEEITRLSIKSATDDVKIQYLEDENKRLKQNNREGARGTDRRFFTGG